jgi:prepilin-type N-terminal cleavage/methylation domain-containing protein
MNSTFRHGKSLRNGFTLAEVAVAALIVAALAAVTIPQVLDALDKKRVSDTQDILRELHSAIINTNRTGFANLVRTGAAAGTEAAPGRLSHLSHRISTTDPTSCPATNYNATAVSNWQTFGPFTSRIATSGGLRTPIGQLQNTIFRNQAAVTPPAASDPSFFLWLRITSVDERDAAALDRLVDGDNSPTAGTIQYVASGGTATVDYYIPIFNRC